MTAWNGRSPSPQRRHMWRVFFLRTHAQHVVRRPIMPMREARSLSTGHSWKIDALMMRHMLMLIARSVYWRAEVICTRANFLQSILTLDLVSSRLTFLIFKVRQGRFLLLVLRGGDVVLGLGSLSKLILRLKFLLFLDLVPYKVISNLLTGWWDVRIIDFWVWILLTLLDLCSVILHIWVN